MDDPDIANSVGVAVEQTDTMTSLSPSKRTIALGVVNTTGMKSSSSNRKRRWDQPPDESGEMPCVKKVHLNEPVESPESALERLNEESDDSPNKCNLYNSNEPDCMPNSDQVMSDGDAMSIDVLPEEVCDRLGGLSEVSDVTASSEHNECKSTIVVSSTVACSDSGSDEKLNNISSDLRLGDGDEDKETDTRSSPVSDNPVATNKEQKRITSSVISHQSEELRRIMFSYNEGTSESDSNDSNGVSLNTDSSDNKAEKTKLENSEDISKLESIKKNSKPNINPISETSISLNDNRLSSGKKENCFSDEDLTKGSEQTDSKSYNDVDSIEMADSSINTKSESQINIPNKNELLLNTPEVNCVQVSEHLFTETDKTISLESDSISSIKSDEHILTSDVKSKKCNEQVECDSSSIIDNCPKSAADSLRFLDEKVSDCSNETEVSSSPVNIVPVVCGSNERVVNTTEGDSKNENSSDLTRSDRVISEVNEVKIPEDVSEMLMATTEIHNINEPTLDTPCLTTDSIVNLNNEGFLEKSMMDDSYKTEQLPNLSSIKENSIDVNESCLDDENSNTLKTDMENASSVKMSCDLNSGDHLKTMDSDNEKMCDTSRDLNFPETIKSCISPVETPISITDESESKAATINDPGNNIEKINESPPGSPSSDVDTDVMKVIFGSTGDCSRGVDSIKDKISSVGPSPPDSDSNPSKSILLDTQMDNETLPDSAKESIINCEVKTDEPTGNVDTSMKLELPESVKENDLLEGESSILDTQLSSSETQELVTEESNKAADEDIVMEEEELIDKPDPTPPLININEKEEILVDQKAQEESEVLDNEVEMLDESSIISKSSIEVIPVDEACKGHLKQGGVSSVLISKPTEKEEEKGKDENLVNPISEENITPQENSIEDEVKFKAGSSEPHKDEKAEEHHIEPSELSCRVMNELPIISDDIKSQESTDSLNVKEIVSQEKSVSPTKEANEIEAKEKTELTGVEEIEVERTGPTKPEEIEVEMEKPVKPPQIEEFTIAKDSTKVTKAAENEIIDDKTLVTKAEAIDIVEEKTQSNQIKETEVVIEETNELSKVEDTEIELQQDSVPPKVDEIEEESGIVMGENPEPAKEEEIVESSVISQDDKEDAKSDTVLSPSNINEPIVNNNEDSKGITEEIETFDVVEEVVTCENSGSEKAVEPEIEEIINEDENAQFASEETQESVESSDDLVAVMDNDTSDAKASDNENQNIVISTEIFINADDNMSSEANEEKEDMEVVESVNAPCKLLPDIETICETATINSIAKVPNVDEEMEVDEVESVVKNDIPLLKTVSSPSMQKKEQNIFEKENVKEESLQKSESKNPSLEPSILKVYKDNLTIKTDDLDTPKKHKSSKDSPHSKTLDNICSLSPQNKQFEYTLKIAKDANTNFPKATMSPKSNMSPSWKLESGPNSPHSPGESGVGTLKLKLSKPSPSALSNDLGSSPLGQSNKLEDVSMRLGMTEEKKKDESKTPLPKQPLEMGSALKMMIEVDKAESSRPEGSSILEQALSGSGETPSSKKRGRPRLENDINHSPKANPGEGEGAADTGESGALDTSGEDQSSSRQVRSCRARTQPIVAKPRKPRGGAATPRGGGRGGARGVARPIASAEEAEKIQEKLSEKEKAELAKIEARKEKMRLDRIAKNEAKKAKKLAKKLKDEERRKRIAAEKAEKAAAAAPQVFEEETRMSASESRGHTPAPSSRLMQSSEGMEESQYSLGGTPVATPKTGNHKGRMEIPIDPESDEVRVDQLAEYQWQGSELCMIQEQVSLYLGVKSFKRKYPDLRRRIVEAEERAFLEDSGLVSKNMCDLGLTAVSSAEILDIMYQDFPDKYEAFRQYVRDKQAKEMSFKQKALASQTQTAKAKGELRELALEAAAMWNSNLNRERREERRCALDLQTFTVHYPKHERERMAKSPLRPGLYPVSVIPGQFSDYYKTYTPTELMYFPLNTVMYGPLKPNERRDGSDSSSSSSDDSSGTSDSENDSDDEERVSKECKICNGEKKSINETHPEILLQCSQCKGLCHPTCQEITPEMLPHIKKYSWHCSNCKKCVQCKDTSKEEKMLFCDLCDRGYHISCVGLRKSPEGRWHCSVCSFCTLCGSKDPGGPEWFYEYKKTDKGVRLYQRTLCVPCSKVLMSHLSSNDSSIK